MKRNLLLGLANVAKSTYYLRHVRLSVGMYISAAPTENIFVTFDIGDFIKIIQFWLKLGKKYRPFYMKTGPGSSVGIAISYGLDGPGIESRWGRDFPHLSRPVLGPTQPPVQWVPGLFRA
jgi:hypothetical protein